VSNTYVSLAEKITGQTLEISDNPKAEILAVLREKYGLVD
jgi:phosphoribosylaminoimidazole-succinocarboxamide synthase